MDLQTPEPEFGCRTPDSQTRVHTVQDAPLHHPQCSYVAVHRHLGARGISCTELHRAPRCRRTSLHRHRRCERVAPNPGTGGAVCL